MNRISRVVSVFHGRALPESGCTLAGYAALIEKYELNVPLPERCACIGQHHNRYDTPDWSIYTPRHKPEDSLSGHLTFALKYEGIDLSILSALFSKIDPEEITAWVSAEPVGRYSRRIWFFYEWLTEKQLNLTDAKVGNFVDALDLKQQYVGHSQISRRHRIRNNLPGVRNFCPLVRCTDKLKKYQALHLSSIACESVKKTPHDLIKRASAFLLLKDSRASFQIEHEYPEQGRAERWAQALGQAGRNLLTKEEILRLQKVVLENTRFVELGFRQEGGFIGTHDRLTGMPIPDHISARWEDVNRLMDGLISMFQLLINKENVCKNNTLKDFSFDPIILAACVAFGFVFIHPLVDGNGRIHRYLIQHILAQSGFASQGLVFPISAVILERIEEYKHVLEAYSSSRLECIEWKPTDHGNVEVLNQTIDLYRYFDATKQVEFLYDCINQAITQSLPEEIDYLMRYDRMKAAIKEQFDMPEHIISLLIRFLEQGNGKLSKRSMANEFKALSSDECRKFEELFADIFKK
jgi:hypothetical protein